MNERNWHYRLLYAGLTSSLTPLTHLGIMKTSKKNADTATHPHQQRALTKIRVSSGRVMKKLRQAREALNDAETWLSEVDTIARENDARELKKRPSLKKKRGTKKRR